MGSCQWKGGVGSCLENSIVLPFGGETWALENSGGETWALLFLKRPGGEMWYYNDQTMLYLMKLTETENYTYI